MSYGLRARPGIWGLGRFEHYGLGDFNPPSPPSYEDCDPRDTACVERNQAKDVAYQQGVLEAQANNDRDVCVSNAQQSPEPYQSQMMADCAARWPAGAATTVPVQNLPAAALPAVFQTPAQAAQPYVNAAAQAAAAQAAAAANPTPTVTTSGGTTATVGPPQQTTPVVGAGSGGFNLAQSFNCTDPTTCWFGFPKWAVIAAAAGVGLFMLGGRR